MDKRKHIIAGADMAFEAGGFRGIGVDGILAASGASTRTLYKHFGSRDGLVLAVLEERHKAFADQLDAEWKAQERGEGGDPVGGLFDTLESWLAERGAHGCMLLRARSEYAGASEAIVALVARQKKEFAGEIGRRVRAALGRDDPDLAAQTWILFEGAMAAASVSDLSVIGSAKRAAHILLQAAKQEAQP